jgi:hypothetical protein
LAKRPACATVFTSPGMPVALHLRLAPALSHASKLRPVKEDTMRRYHFDLVDTNSVTDVTGAVLDDDDHARKVALALVGDARKDRPGLMGRGYWSGRTPARRFHDLHLISRQKTEAALARSRLNQTSYGTREFHPELLSEHGWR